jgi:hypothetical protein
MSTDQTSNPVVTTTVLEVLPNFGLAYLVDDCNHTWTITHGTKGPGLGDLLPGQRCELTLDTCRDFTLVSEYRLLS